MIELENVTKHYGHKVAVASLDLVVPRGELFAFLGPNGAGKTTTIKMLVGLLRPSSGTVKLCGVDVVKNPREAGGRLGYVPDDAYLYDKLSGREILRFITDMHGFDSREAKSRIAREIDDFGLGDFVDELTETYSHGMKQRLVFASALLHDPAVLVVDEPMVGLDPRSVRLVKDLLRAKAAAGMTIFLSTHTLSMAEEIADRIGIVDHGRLRFLGTVAELRRELPAQDRSLEQFFLKLTAENAAPREDAAVRNPA
ncbi:MAG: ABC transporter ATP-binding protein [Pirellulales bacterium]